MKSIKYVINENLKNLYRIFCIAKYEILADNRDSKLGMLWSFLDPLIQIVTYWFAFGLGIRGGQDVHGVKYLNWMIVGILPWFFLSKSIREGTSAIYNKSKIITKMEFPVSILPTTVIAKQLFNHLATFLLVYLFLMINGIKPHLFNFRVVYYLICAIAFSISLAMITSVLNMFTRDVKKFINAIMRLLMFATPILWTMDKLPHFAVNIMKANPLYYIVEGYRNSLIFNKGIFTDVKQLIVFWVIVITMFVIGSNLMYKFRQKFIDFI